MTNSSLRGWVAALIVVGHIAVFVAGLFLGIFTLLNGVDAVQTLLMASPILATTAAAAFTYAMERSTSNRSSRTEDGFVVALSFFIPIALMSLIFSIFVLFYLQVDGFGPDQLKISLGAIEAIFGVFLGAMSKKLFST